VAKVVRVLSVLSVLIFSYAICASEDPGQDTQTIDTFYGIASWYSEDDAGILPTTANMEIFDDEGLTCAIWDVPFHTLIRVTNQINGKSVIVRVNDRGPAKRLVKEGRIIDLTKAAFAEIASLDEGLIQIKMEILPQITSLAQ